MNEQNPQAVDFYAHFGFRTYRRTERDEEGGPIRCCICVCPLTTRKQITKGRAPLNAGHGLSVLSFIESGDQG